MLPLEIAGRVLLQEMNPLIIMYYTRTTPKHWQTQQFLCPAGHTEFKYQGNVNNWAVCACKDEIIANGKVYVISKPLIH